ncbi:MAG: tetratricopeptide repeat protein [Planctomycetia bacterium]|nr:tetratricopeptide repeat protein [Planctomycetia bacterium]
MATQTQPAHSATAASHGGDDSHRTSGSSRGATAMRKLPWVLGTAAAMALVSGAVSFLMREPEAPPDREFETAFKYLDEDALLKRDDDEDRKLLSSARRIALALQEKGYQDRKFPSGVSFVLGMCAFREAIAYDDVGRDQRYLTAATYLSEVPRQSIPEERRPEWAFAAGISLYRIGRPDEAQPLLKDAVDTYPEGKHEAGLLLTQVYMDGRSRQNMKAALELNSDLIADATLRADDRDTAWLQRAQILLALDRRDESIQALDNVSKEKGTHASHILMAQTKMADGKFREAIEILAPLSREVGLERAYPAQALYLMGTCADQLGELENAVVHYLRTTERYGQTHEGLASRLGAASALRRLGRNEEALELYATVLRSVTRPKSFRNRWLSLKRLQEMVIEAWNSWMEHHDYGDAIFLADVMSPAIPYEQAVELMARANQRWAEHLEAELAKVPADRYAAHKAKLEERWRLAGRAYARLAENSHATADYYNALWTSAEDYTKGHDYPSAIENLNQFIENRLSSLLPLALVHRGQCHLNLDRLDDAMHDFEEAISNNPTDPVAFQARYLVGRCHLEHNDPDQAELAWRKILDSPDLAPTAVEWRTALYSLGKLLYDTADLARRKALQQAVPGQAPAYEQQTAILARFDEAILRLEEFRDRYPAMAETVEVRFLLAQALQRSSGIATGPLETDNARNEFRRQMHERLDRAIRELQQLQALLKSKLAAGQLDESGQGMLRTCFFDIPNCLFLLERYEKAIAAYSTYAGSYQHEPDSLIAYIQMANCYERLGKLAEAHSTLAQAQLILKQLPDNAFSTTTVAMSRTEWQRWLDWAMKLHN